MLTFTFLSANNPKPYAVLGDVIYNNVEKIKSLENLNSYKEYKNDIAKYVEEVNATKNEGFKLELGKANISKKEYLVELRKLSKLNDYFLRSVKTNYKNSMDSNNYNLFSEIINSGLIDTKKNIHEIVDYYYKHKEDINSTGIIEKLLNDDAKLKALKEAERRRHKTKKMLEEEKIKRIRAEDKEAQRALELKLQKELENKKLKIREEQKKELAN
jgi:hypothetical protein